MVKRLENDWRTIGERLENDWRTIGVRLEMEDGSVFSFRKLLVYKLAQDLIKQTYDITSGFPDKERFVLVPQINRAAISIASNIAEGSSRFGVKDRSHFINIAYCSLMEAICQMDIALNLGYIDETVHNSYMMSAKDLAIRLNNFQKYIKNNL